MKVRRDYDDQVSKVYLENFSSAMSKVCYVIMIGMVEEFVLSFSFNP